jgi:hypothetical protein
MGFPNEDSHEGLSCKSGDQKSAVIRYLIIYQDARQEFSQGIDELNRQDAKSTKMKRKASKAKLLAASSLNFSWRAWRLGG